MSLQTNLSAFWQFENTSWTDELGVNDLTGTNSPTSVAGLVGNAVKFASGASMQLSHANATELSLGGVSFSIQLWVNLVSGLTAGGFFLLAKNDGGFGNREYSIGTEFTTTTVWSWKFEDNGGSGYNCPSTTAISAGFHHIVCTWDGTTQKIYVDAGAPQSAVPGAVMANTTSTFQIGANGASFPSASQDVLIDQVGIWKGRTLSAADVTELYNGGAGLTYAAMAGASPVTTLYSLINVG